MGTDNIADDNSGTLKYVRIEFAGIALSNTTNSEINGLTLYAVGSGTTIDHVQVSYSGDDSFEWFGGTVNAKNLIAFRGWDDDWDTDWGFTGKIQYALSLRDPEFADQSGSNGFESNNFANAGEPATRPNYFNAATRKNTILADASTLLLNAANFNLAAPAFLPQATSPLLKDAVCEGKAADAFFTKEIFRGAFGTEDWTKT